MVYQLKKLLVLSLLIATGCAAQIEGPVHSDLANRLPRAYSGVFKWHGDSAVQSVSIAIDEVFVNAEQSIIANGTGKYLTMFRETDIEIKIAIVPETLRFEMWERSSEGISDFVTDGSHIGAISKDLKAITAVWTTRETGQQGNLKLEAK